MNNNMAKIEALIYASGDQGINLIELSQRAALDKAACRQLIERLKAKLASDEQTGLCLFQSEETYRLGTKAEYGESVQDYINDIKPRVLSQAALETMAIILYNQPITRIEIDQIRGVNSSAIIHRLINQDLIEVTGVKQEVGSPKLYGATNFGLDYFGLDSIESLPKLPKDDTLNNDTSDNLLTRFNKEIDSTKDEGE